MRTVMKVYLAKLPGTPASGHYEDFVHLARCDRHGIYRLVSSANEADIIFFPCVHTLEDRRPYEALTQSKFWRKGHPRMFVYVEDDVPVCIYQGIYVSMPRSSFNNDRQRSGPFRKHMNPRIEDFRHRGQSTSPTLLGSFTGQTGTALRRAIGGIKHVRISVRKTDDLHIFDRRRRNALATEKAFDDYIETSLRSKFVLCPRGGGTSSFRLFETLALGRVPVILSDEWMPPTGPDWSAISIRIPEREAHHVPAILELAEVHWEKMALQARMAYDVWFAEDVRFHRMMQLCVDIMANKKISERVWVECFYIRRLLARMLRLCRISVHFGGNPKTTLRGRMNHLNTRTGVVPCNPQKP